MDLNTTVIAVVCVSLFTYLVRLVIREKGDVEARGRTGTSEFVLKAKDRKK
jgi:hypothetical protein